MKKILDILLTAFIIPLLFLSISPLGILNVYPWITYLLLCICIVVLVIINLPFKEKIERNVKYEIEAMPIPDHPIRGREETYNRLVTVLGRKNNSKLIYIEGELGIGKTSLVSSYVMNNKKKHDLIIWQPLSDIPVTREIINSWLNIYSESIPELALNARIDAFIRQLRDKKKKNVLIIFDNVESMLIINNNVMVFPDDFVTLLNRMVSINEIRTKIVLTSAVDLENILHPLCATELVEVGKLKDTTLQQIIIDRTSQEVSLDSISAACGNPSAALLLAGIAGEQSMLAGVITHSEKESLTPLVDKRLEMLSADEQLLVLFLCIIRLPLSVTELQQLWCLIPPYSALNPNRIEKLRQVYVVEVLAGDRIIINPIVAEIMLGRISDDLASVLVGNTLNTASLICNLPLDYAKFSDKIRINTKLRIFPDVRKKVEGRYSISVSMINVERVINNLADVKSKGEYNFLPSNVINFFLFLGQDLSGLVFPKMELYGVDFSRAHMFNMDLLNVQLIDCIFADRNGSAYATCFMKEDSILVGLASGSVELRNVKDLQRFKRIEVHSEPVRAVYYSPQYEYILSAGEDGRLVIYNNLLEVINSFRVHSRWIWRIVPIAEKYVITVACDNTMGLIDLETATIACKISVPSQRIWDAAVINSELYLVTEEGTIWKQSITNIIQRDINNWELVTAVSAPIKACCVCSNTLVFGCRDYKLYKLDSRNESILISKENGCIRDLCTIPDSNKVISVGDTGVAYIYDISERICVGEMEVQSSRTWQIDICNSIAVTVGDDRTVHLWDVSELSSIKISSGNGQSLRSVDIHDGCYRYACADDFLRFSNGDAIYPWISMGSRKRILGFVGLENKKWACSFDNGEIIFGQENSIRDTRKEHDSAIESIARNSDGTLFATGGEDRTIKVFDSDGRIMPSPRPLHSSRIWSLGFSFDNEMLASAGGDFIVAIWRVKDGQLIANCVGHNNLVLSVCWLDNERLVSAGTDGTIRLWEAKSGNPLMIKPISGLIRGLATDRKNNIYGVGRITESTTGWYILKWDITTNTIQTKTLSISGGSARTVVFDEDKLMIGGDMPFWLQICAETFDVISKQRIPGIYSGARIKKENLDRTDFESLGLLGADIV